MCRLAGRHFFHSIAGAWPVNTRLVMLRCGLKIAASADSKGKLLVAGTKALQRLARDSLDIVAFWLASTTYRAAAFSSASLSRRRWAPKTGSGNGVGFHLGH